MAEIINYFMSTPQRQVRKHRDSRAYLVNICLVVIFRFYSLPRSVCRLEVLGIGLEIRKGTTAQDSCRRTYQAVETSSWLKVRLRNFGSHGLIIRFKVFSGRFDFCLVSNMLA